MSKSQVEKTPKVGDEVEVNILYGTIPGTVIMVLNEEMIVVNALRDKPVLATLSKFGIGWMFEPTAERAWKYPAYAKFRRTENQKKVGDRVAIKIDTVVPSKDGDQHRWLPMAGTVKAIAEDGATLLDIEGFELYCGADYWIKEYQPTFPDGDQGVYLPSGLRIS